MTISPPVMVLEAGNSSTLAIRNVPPAKSRAALGSLSSLNLCVDSRGQGASSACETGTIGPDSMYVLALRERVEEVLREIEVRRKNFFRRHIDPVGDRERAVLGERAVVERQDEVARLVADALNRMAVALGEVPQVARLEVVDLACARRLEHHGLAPPVDDVGPFGGDGVPMQLARRARVEEHMDARDPLAHGELMDRRLLRPTAGGDLWIVAVERKDVVRHLLDVFGIMVRNLGAGWQLHRIAAIAAVP